MESRNYHVFLERQRGEGYLARVAELPGCLSEGRTEEEALRNVRDAIRLYMEDVEAEALARKAAGQGHRLVVGQLQAPKSFLEEGPQGFEQGRFRSG